MNIPINVFWEIMLVLGGFVFGTLLGHHAQIGKRVTYDECSKKRDKCPCIKDIEEIKHSIERER
jgi:hypothetical protein